MSHMSFDEWSKLYKLDPEEFERKRREAIEAEICKAPVERRAKLRLLQMEIDAVRQSHSSPLAATAAISVMMHNKAAELKQALSGLNDSLGTLQEELKKLE